MEILIVGATARAAAMSALRAGLKPTTIDLFADRDLQAVARTIRVLPDDYPQGLVSAALKLSPLPFLYTGGLENFPALVDQIASHHTLWGNASEVLALIRDPFVLATTLTNAGFRFPPISRVPPIGAKGAEAWLVKPVASAGGMGIAFWSNPEITKNVASAEKNPTNVYYQQYILGLSGSAIYLCDRAGVELVAMNIQLVGEPGQPFVYRGNLTPMVCEPETCEELQRLGKFLHAWAGLRGVFGVDFILSEGRPWIIEVNPRYTASVELVEFSTGRSLLAEHRRAFDRGAPRPSQRRREAPGVLGKLVVYARKPSGFPKIEHITSRNVDTSNMPRCADIPPAGERFAPGDPVLTLLGRGETAKVCQESLDRRADRWRRRIGRVDGLT